MTLLDASFGLETNVWLIFFDSLPVIATIMSIPYVFIVL